MSTNEGTPITQEYATGFRHGYRDGYGAGFTDGSRGGDVEPLLEPAKPEAPMPLLGLATTEQLLEEIATRMYFHQTDLVAVDLRRHVLEAKSELAPTLLEYRTVGSGD